MFSKIFLSVICGRKNIPRVIYYLAVINVLFEETLLSQSSPWPLVGHDTRNSFQSELISAQDSITDWWINVKSGRPILLDQNGDLYTSADSFGTYTYAISSLGTLKWRLPRGIPRAITSNGIILTKSDGTINAITTSGQLLWSKTLPLQISSITTDDSTIYVSNGYHLVQPDSMFKLYALNLDGIEKWTYSLNASLREYSDALITCSGDGNLYITTMDGTLISLDASTGNHNWTITAHFTWNDQGPMIGVDGTIYVAKGSTISSFKSTGQLKWTYVIGNAYNSHSALAEGVNGHIYTLLVQDNGDYSLVALDTSGIIMWQVENIDYHQTYRSRIVVGGDNMIYTNGDSICAFNEIGQLIWTFRQPTYYLAIGTEGQLYAATGSNGVRAFLTPITKSLTLNAPNGGESWQVDGTYDITWNSENITDVKIDYTTDNGISWINITTSTPSNGLYSWMVPNTPATECKIRITDVSNPSVSDESDNTFTIVYHIPVVIIPGIMGSPLFNDLDNNNHLIRNPTDFANDEFIWADTKQGGFDFYDVFLEELSLNPDGNTSNFNIKVAPLKNDIFTTIGDIMSYKPFDTYYGLIYSLVIGTSNYKLNDFDYNHDENEDLYVYTYDWRKSCDYNANLLNELIDSIFIWNSVTKVNLICHSMGGLIAKKYLTLSGLNNSKINKLILIGTPQLGSPKILYVMLRGKLGLRWLEDFGLYDARIRKISRNMPTTYELMPSLNYSDLFIDTGPRNNKYLYNYFFDTPQFGYTNYYQMLQFFNSVVLPDNFTYNSVLDNNAHIFREEIADIDISGVEVFNIVGYGKPTIGRVTVKEGWWGLGDIDPDNTEGLMNLSGDGTVPLRSAEIFNLNKTVADFYINEVEHSELPSSEPVKELISNLLKEPAILTFNNPAITDVPPVEYAGPYIKQVTVSSPVELHAYDLIGNHTGPTSDSTWEALIPGSQYLPGDLRIPHSSKTILIPQGTNFRIEILSQDTTASFNYKLNEIIDGISEREFSFDSIVILDNTIANMDVYDTTTTFGLGMDYDGNGMIDSTILPSVINFCINDSLNTDWNIISLPYLTEQNLKTILFPTASSNAFWFNGGYVIRDTLEVRKGYWLKFDLPVNNIICGQRIDDTIHINVGWNMIGCINEDAPVSEIDTDPPGILSSNFFGFTDGYSIADTLKLGKGYWIKSDKNGVINLNQSINKTLNNIKTIDKSWTNIIISDSRLKEMKLYFAKDINTDYYQLPPLPPTGVFDIRFETGTMVEDLSKENKLINISGASYPINVKASGIKINIRDVINGTILNETISDGESIVIYDNKIDKILIRGENSVDIPITYSLEQNYPNPFNPNTIIRFAIPEEVKVNIELFNILGERIKELKNELMKPGYYEVEFNASTLATGVYFYRIIAGDFIKTKKMMLIK